jgi:hypothetical protein
VPEIRGQAAALAGAVHGHLATTARRRRQPVPDVEVAGPTLTLGPVAVAAPAEPATRETTHGVMTA